MLKRLKGLCAFPFFLWLIQLINTLVIAFIFTNIINHGQFQDSQLLSKWIEGLGSWDGNWYLSIAEKGYTNLQSTAFFPLYPITIKTVHSLLGFSYFASGLIIANFAFLIALIYLYRLASDYLSDKTAKYSLWLLVLFPTAMFYNVIYTESLTLLTTVLFFYFLKKEKWYLSMLSGFFATAVHDLGVVLAISGFVYLWRRRFILNKQTFIVRLLSLGLIPLSLIIYMVYLYTKYGTPIAFMEAQSFWGREPVIPIISIFLVIIKVLTINHNSISDWNYVFMMIVNGVCTLIILIYIIIMLFDKEKLFPVEMKVFASLTLLLSICSGTGGDLQSFGRFVAVVFPAFLSWARSFKNETILLAAFLTMFMTKVVLVGLFSDGYWVT
jgi:ABC-type multidrug transport system fused ATPase/permease subunit